MNYLGMFKALQSDSITLHLLKEDSLAEIYEVFQEYPDSKSMLEKLVRNYLPRYKQGQRTNFGFNVKPRAEPRPLARGCTCRGIAWATGR